MQIISTFPSIENSTSEASKKNSGGLNTAMHPISLAEDAFDITDFSRLKQSDPDDLAKMAEFATLGIAEEMPVQPRGSNNEALKLSDSLVGYGRQENDALQIMATAPNTVDAPKLSFGKDTLSEVFSYVSNEDDSVRLPNPKSWSEVVGHVKNEVVAVSSNASELPRLFGRDPTDGSHPSMSKTAVQNKDMFPVENGQRQSTTNLVDMTSDTRALPEIVSKRPQTTTPIDQSIGSQLSVNHPPNQSEQEFGYLAPRTNRAPQQQHMTRGAHIAVAPVSTSHEHAPNLHDAHVTPPEKSDGAQYQKGLSGPDLQMHTRQRNPTVKMEFQSGTTAEVKSQFVFGHLETTISADSSEVPASESPQTASHTRVSTPLMTRPNALNITIEPNAIFRQISTSVPVSTEGSIEVRLWPEELGRVRLTMTPSEAGMNVQVAAERPEVLELMRRHIGQFEQELLNQGFTHLAFSFDDESSDAQDETAEWVGETPVELIKNFDSHPTSVSAGHVDIRL